MLSFLCEIIDGENVMRNYPSTELLRPLTMAEQVLAPYVTPIFETESSDSSQFSRQKVSIHLSFRDGNFRFISVASVGFGRCLVFRPRQSGDWTRLEMRPLPKSEMKQKWKVNPNKAIFPQFPISSFLSYDHNWKTAVLRQTCSLVCQTCMNIYLTFCHHLSKTTPCRHGLTK